MKKILLAGVLGIGLFSACNDNYLEKYPLTSLTEQNAFLDYSNYKAYMYPCVESSGKCKISKYFYKTRFLGLKTLIFCAVYH